MKKIIISLLMIAVLILSVNVGMAAGAYTYTAEAQKLNDLGLYKGISTETFDPDLGSALTREQGVAMLIRIFGLEEEAQKVADADATLAKFSDASSVSEWAKKYVAYGIEKGLIQGMPDGTFAPKTALNGKAYCTLILRQLGYTPDYNNSPALLADKGGLNKVEVVKFMDKELIRDDLVGITFGTLSAKGADSKTVIEKLIDKGIVTSDEVKEEGISLPTITQPESPKTEEEQQQPTTPNKSYSGYVGIITKVKEITGDEVQVTILNSRGSWDFKVTKDDREDVTANDLKNDPRRLDKDDDLEFFKGLLVECLVDAKGYMMDNTISFNNHLDSAKFYEVTDRDEIKLLFSDDSKDTIDAYKYMFVAEADLNVDGTVQGMDDIEKATTSDIEEVDEDLQDYSVAHTAEATTVYYYTVEVDEDGDFYDINGTHLEDAKNSAVLFMMIIDPNEDFTVVE